MRGCLICPRPLGGGAEDLAERAEPRLPRPGVVALAGAKLDLSRYRIQQLTCGHRGRTGDCSTLSDGSCGLGCRCSAQVENAS